MSSPADRPVLTYDPFGEPVEIVGVGTSVAGDRRARNVAVLGFWVAAAILTAGRIYFADQSVGQMVAGLHGRVAAFLSVIL